MENQNAAKKRKNKLGTRRKGFIIAFLAPTLIAFCVFYLYPIITVFITSFCKWDYTNITSPEFFGWSNLWDITVGGSSVAGDTSIDAAVREVREEVGIQLSPAELRKTMTIDFGHGFDDFYTVTQDVDISTLKLLKEEVQR